MVIPCDTCASAQTMAARFQNEQYGIGQRVHNLRKDGTVRCTVCDTVRLAPKDTKK